MNWKRGHPQKRDDSRGLGEARARGVTRPLQLTATPVGKMSHPGFYTSVHSWRAARKHQCVVCLSVYLFLFFCVCLFVCLSVYSQCTYGGQQANTSLLRVNGQ